MTAMGRTLPHSLDAERTVVGGVLLRPAAFDEIADLVDAADFYHPAHAAIFAAFVALDAAGKPIDPITVDEQMRIDESSYRLKALGGIGYLAELTSQVVSVENIGYHAETVRAKATMRGLIAAAQEIAARGCGEVDAGEYVDEAEAAIFAAARRSRRTGAQTLLELLPAAVRAVEERAERRQEVTGVPTALADLDAMTAGFQAGDLVIIAARPSVGKTALAMNAALNAARFFGAPSLILSLEMSRRALVERLICCDALIDSSRLRSGLLGADEWRRFTASASRLSQLPISIDDPSSPTLLDLRAKARRWRARADVARARLAQVVVDGLWLMNHRREKGENTTDAIGRSSHGLKALAKDLALPMVVLHQLNRGPADRADKRPQLSDLRASGDIEQDADLVVFIHPDEKQPDVVELIIAKQRNGATGSVRVAFDRKFTRFENLASNARQED